MSLCDDLRQALRTLARRPSLVLTAVLTLAAGVGATTGVFAVVYGVLLRPLPWPEADRLVRLSEGRAGTQGSLREPLLSQATARAWSTAPRSIEGLAAWSRETLTLRLGDELQRIPAVGVSPSLFALLRARPAWGRFFTEQEASVGADGVVVLSAALCRQLFGSAPACIEKKLIVDGTPRLVVGVTPDAFFFPDRDTLAWTPYVFPETDEGTVFRALARLRPGVSPTMAAAEGTAVARGVSRPAVHELLFGKGGPLEVQARALGDEMTASVRPALLVFSAAVGLLLVLVCANLANLLLSHGLARGRELAVRSALGAGRARLARLLLAEGVVLALAGGSLGLSLAAGLVRALPLLAPRGFPRIDDVHLDLPGAAFALLAASTTGLLASFLPAWRASRADLEPALHAGTTVTSAGRRSGTRVTLLVVEAALSVLLLVGASLLARSFARLLQVDPGYDAERVLVARLVSAQAEGAIPHSSVRTLLDRLRATPNVVAAGAGNMVPFASMTALAGATLPWKGADGQPIQARVRYYSVTTGYAQALGLRRRAGRLLKAGDAGARPRPLLVNEAFVRQYLADGRPTVGRQMKGAFAEDEATLSEIVGVVGNVLKDGLDGTPLPELYVAAGPETEWGELNVVARTTGDPAALVPVLRAAVRESDAPIALDTTAPLARRVSESLGRPRFAAYLLGAFSAIALALSASGLFGVLSYTVSLRGRELGIRAALGAARSQLVGLVLRQAMAVTAAGIALGLLAALAGARLVAGLLFGITPWDVPSLAAAVVLPLGTAVLASVLPARRAAASDPAAILRRE